MRKSHFEFTVTQSRASQARSVADSLVSKDGNLFFISGPEGEVSLEDSHGYGLYYKDCRWLGGFELKVGGEVPATVHASDWRPYECRLQRTNAFDSEGERGLETDSLEIRVVRKVRERDLTFTEDLTITNRARWAQNVPVELAFRTGFDDVYQVRSLSGRRKKQEAKPRWRNGALEFRRRGLDNVLRILTVKFSRRPKARRGCSVSFSSRLARNGSWRIVATLKLREESVALSPNPNNVVELRASRRNPQGKNPDGGIITSVETDDVTVNQILRRSFDDVRLLGSSLLGASYVSAGVPWFATLFGRDSLISALELLPYDRCHAADTLRLLARLQADSFNSERRAEPGKILHELRVGELAGAGLIPQTPYFGTVDATPLFLILLGRHAEWEGSTALFGELRGSVEAALGWIGHNAARSRDGFLRYWSPRSVKKGLVNQGWKDGGNSILDEKGMIPEPPIALVEVQAYYVEALVRIAGLFERTGEAARARALREKAAGVRKRLNEVFWSEKAGTFGMALAARSRRLQVVSSNAGHVLWSGVADPGKAAATVRRLMSDDMFAGWGVRTLSSKERGYHPLGYHLGTIWPHDCAMIAEGFRRYGFDREALLLVEGLTEAARFQRYGRLPELFAGYSRSDYHRPVLYPVACRPQAWAAASYPNMFATLLGLRARGFERRLDVVAPMLPAGVHEANVKGLKVGDATVDLHFFRARDGRVKCEKRRVEGDLEVRIMDAEAGRRAA